MNKSIEQNIKAHDKLQGSYNHIHGEIFNDIEQNRLKSVLKKAHESIHTNSTSYTALDFGCGTGNLTKYLLNLHMNVIASDVSSKFLEYIENKFQHYKDQLQTSLLNGIDLKQFNDNSFDMVATYSVLHHVPDYLPIIAELIRVTKKGGVIIIDHEASADFWLDKPLYLKFTELNPKPFPYKKLFQWQSYKTKFIKLFNPKYQPEGDIHVFKDDHIEWEKIEDLVKKSGAKIIYKKAYLLFKEHYNKELYKKYKSRINDMQVMIIQK